jgi:hypothetical protein
MNANDDNQDEVLCPASRRNFFSLAASRSAQTFHSLCGNGNV